MSKYKHKRGDTFELIVRLKAIVNAVSVTDLTGYTAVSRIRDPKGVLIASLDFAWIDATQSIARFSAISSLTWPLTNAIIDIALLTPAGKRITSDSETFLITEAQSRD